MAKVDVTQFPGWGVVSPVTHRVRRGRLAPAVDSENASMIYARKRRAIIAVVEERPAVSIISIVVLSDTSIRVNFNRGARDNAALHAAENYVISGAPAGVEVLEAFPEEVESPTYVVLNLKEMRNGRAYTLTILRVDPDANLVDITGTFVGQGTAPTITHISTPADDRVRVHFSEAVAPDGDVVTTAGYSLVADVGSVTRQVLSVAPENEDAPTYVDLVLDGEMTIGVNNYNVSVLAAITDIATNPLSGSTAFDFNGRGTRPSIEEVTDTVEIVRVLFSEPVKQVSALNANDALNPANYSISGDTTVTIDSVTSVSAALVELGVTGQIEGGHYRLRVSNVEDVANNAIL